MAISRATDDLILGLARSSHGALARWQLRERDVDPRLVARRVSTGRIRPHLDGSVYLAGSVADPPPRIAHLAACVLAGGPGAMLGYEELARLLGVWNRPSGIIDVCTVRHRRPLGELGVRFRRMEVPLPRSRVQVVDGIEAVDVARMLTQLGEVLGSYQLAFVIDQLAVTGRLDVRAFRREMRDRHHRRGMQTTRAAWRLVQDGCTGTYNRSEDRQLELMHDHGLEPLVNTRNATGVAGAIPDFYFPDQRRIVEVDGDWSHGRPLAPEADAARDAAHAAVGIPTLRIPYRRVWLEPGAVMRDIVRFLDRPNWRTSPAHRSMASW